MDDRECEKCKGFVPRGLGLCDDCGWENDLKYFVRTTPEPVPTADEIKNKQQRANWRLMLPLSCGAAALLLLLTIAGLCGYWGPEAWIALLIVPVSVLLHLILFGLLTWISSSSEENIVQSEGGFLIYWGKCLAITLVAHISFLLLVAPVGAYFYWSIEDALITSMLNSLGWMLLLVMISGPGWFAGSQFFFSYPMTWGASLMAMILAFDIGVCGFVVWLCYPLTFQVFQFVMEKF